MAPAYRRLALAATALLLAAALTPVVAAQPNIVVLLSDDHGYGDLGVYGHPTLRTPNIDALAAEGVRFTQWMSANSVCTPSRAALLTGRLPVRSGMTGTVKLRLYSHLQGSGLPDDEVTLPEAIKASNSNYTTAVVGKWHLGLNRNTSTDGWYLPERHGFDSFYGLPVSSKVACEANETYDGDNLKCILMRGFDVIEQPLKYDTLSDRLANAAVDFITAHAGVRPFLLYYGFIQPHVPVFSAPRFVGSSRRGGYGDAVADVDAAVGRVMDAIRATGQADNTIVFFTSDNGGWLEEEVNGGTNGPLKGGKAQTWEGGIRVPGIVWGPGVGVRTGYVSHALVSTMDIFNTALDFAGAPVPTDRIIDGRSIRTILTGAEADDDTASSRFLYHYCGYNLNAMRYGPWKAHFWTPKITDPVAVTCSDLDNPENPTQGCGCDASVSVRHDPPLVYNLDVDPGEKYARDLATDTEAAAALAAMLEDRARHEAALVPAPSQCDTPEDPALQVCCNPPLCRCAEEAAGPGRAAVVEGAWARLASVAV